MVVIRCVLGPSRNLRQLSLLESWLGGDVNSSKVLTISVWMTQPHRHLCERLGGYKIYTPQYTHSILMSQVRGCNLTPTKEHASSLLIMN